MSDLGDFTEFDNDDAEQTSDGSDTPERATTDDFEPVETTPTGEERIVTIRATN